jgi:hypothetical protein
MYKPSFMKNGAGVQAILRLYLKDVRGFNVGINDVKEL